MKDIDFVNVYAAPTMEAREVLFSLLAERKPEQSISHRQMPTWEQHCEFVNSKPYFCWYLISNGTEIVGSVYVTHQREIGIFIFNKHQGKGYGKSAVLKVMDMWPNGKFYANVNPANEASKKLFESIGGRVIQHTYML